MMMYLLRYINKNGVMPFLLLKYFFKTPIDFLLICDII